MIITLDNMILFIIFCVAGWIWECVYMSILDKNLVNRGFLTGPYIPIYGFGGLLVQTAFGQWSNGFLTFNTLKIYLVGALSATILEYIVSYILELAFNARWWDYSNYKFNLKYPNTLSVNDFIEAEINTTYTSGILSNFVPI